MKSRFTPGPWKVAKVRHGDGRVAIGIDAGTKHWVARIPEDTEHGFEREEANANLMSAAPELLDALKEVLREHGLPKQKWIDLIAKAEGRSSDSEGAA
jgi:hypothetical protein